MLLSYFIRILFTSLQLVNNIDGRPHDMQPSLFSDGPRLDGSVTQDFQNIPSQSVGQVTNETKKDRKFHIRSISDGNFRKIPPNYQMEIIFPDSSEAASNAVTPIHSTPNCATTDTFCENFDLYPYQYVKYIIQKQITESHFFFGEDKAPEEFGERMGDSQEESFVCKAVQKLIFPKIAINKNNKWKYVVNQDKHDGFVQGIRIELCRNIGGPCDIIGDPPDGITTSCKQKFIYRRLLSLSDDGAAVPDTFKLPSACCCSYKRDLYFLTRFGTSSSPVKRKR